MIATARPLVSVVLICEQPLQVTGSGCCGKLEGDPALTGAARAFRATCREREGMGLLYRAVRHLFRRQLDDGLVTVVEVDPRNQLYLAPKLWRDVLLYRPGLWRGLRTAFQAFALPAVIVNGRVLTLGGTPTDPDTLCGAISDHLTASCGEMTNDE